jgi:hydrogenase-4 component F
VLVYSDAVNVLSEPSQAALWTEILKGAAALDPTLLKLAFVFVLIGFGTKAGLFPMHAWLPDAHSEAPAPVSALLSGVLLNCALFVILRFAILLNAAVGPSFTQTIFLVFGTLSVVTAALFMLAQRDIKRLLAYSSVENIGLIVLAFGIGGPFGTLAALLHVVNHSLVKALMFCASGSLLLKYHSRDLEQVKGVLQVAPLTGVLLMAGSAALVGAPPFNIFISKFGILSAGMGAGYGWLALLVLAALTLVFAAFFRAISGSVLGPAPLNMVKGERLSLALLPLGVLLGLALLFGLWLPPQVSDLLARAAQVAMGGVGMVVK